MIHHARIRVYPGRQDEHIQIAFQPVSTEATMAQPGMVVVRFGNRGVTPKRGPGIPHRTECALLR